MSVVVVGATACASGGDGSGTGPVPVEPAAPVGSDTLAAEPAPASDSVAVADSSRAAADTASIPRDTASVPRDTAVVEPIVDSDASSAESALGTREAPPVPILPGALLPANRIVAFYGNPASDRMGILGELPPDQMLARLDAEVDAWRTADPSTPVRPALQIIAVMATGDPGRDSLFRLRMPQARIREVAGWAERRNALLFLDVQPGRSTVAAELEPLREWLVRPDVHLALDPEWAMSPNEIPGRRIGSMSAEEINYAIDFLADLVDRYNLPPKILVVHRFTESMVRDARKVRRDPRVQVVMNMDGWGAPAQKRVTYLDIVAPEADQFTGFKLFFRNDRRNGSVMLSPDEILELTPRPVYIQYQ